MVCTLNLPKFYAALFWGNCVWLSGASQRTHVHDTLKKSDEESLSQGILTQKRVCSDNLCQGVTEGRGRRPANIRNRATKDYKINCHTAVPLFLLQPLNTVFQSTTILRGAYYNPHPAAKLNLNIAVCPGEA